MLFNNFKQKNININNQLGNFNNLINLPGGGGGPCTVCFDANTGPNGEWNHYCESYSDSNTACSRYCGTLQYPNLYKNQTIDCPCVCTPVPPVSINPNKLINPSKLIDELNLLIRTLKL